MKRSKDILVRICFLLSGKGSKMFNITRNDIADVIVLTLSGDHTEGEAAQSRQVINQVRSETKPIRTIVLKLADLTSLSGLLGGQLMFLKTFAAQNNIRLMINGVNDAVYNKVMQYGFPEVHKEVI